MGASGAQERTTELICLCDTYAEEGRKSAWLAYVLKTESTPAPTFYGRLDRLWLEPRPPFTTNDKPCSYSPSPVQPKELGTLELACTEAIPAEHAQKVITRREPSGLYVVKTTTLAHVLSQLVAVIEAGEMQECSPQIAPVSISGMRYFCAFAFQGERLLPKLNTYYTPERDAGKHQVLAAQFRERAKQFIIPA